MPEKNCLSCKGESSKQKIAMVTMSEAAWDRNEERHKKEKMTYFVAAIVLAVIIFVTNAVWLVYVGEIKKDDRAGNTAVDDVAKETVEICSAEDEIL